MAGLVRRAAQPGSALRAAAEPRTRSSLHSIARVLRASAVVHGYNPSNADPTSVNLSTLAASAPAGASTMQAMWQTVSPVPYSSPMVSVLGLSGLQVVLGGFDNIYHHELKERLPWTGTAHQEQTIHAIRGGLYTVVFLALAGLHPQGAAAVGLAGVLVGEMGLTLWDFVTEDATRSHRGGLLPSERITHTLLTLNYGALLACWLPVMLNDWAAKPTGIAATWYGAPSAFCCVAAAGVAAWSVRDFTSTKRLARFASNEALAPLTLGIRKPRSRILVTGGTGFIGVPLVKALLREGHDVTVLTRDRAGAARRFEHASDGKISFVESLGALDPSAPLDAVVNLAGEPLAGRRWSKAQQERLFASRVDLTERLVQFLAEMPEDARPAVLVSGSAIGWYGAALPSDDVTEASPAAETSSLSHRLCASWEEAALGAESLGIRVALPRIGIVLGREGGALSQMLTPFEFGLGGPMGSGKQMMPWIHKDDLLRVLAECVNDEQLSGPVNAVAPNPVSNEVLTKTLGSVMRRPTFMRVPEFSLKLLFGADLAHELLLTGQRVVPTRLNEHGFQFSYPDLEPALREIVHGTNTANKKEE